MLFAGAGLADWLCLTRPGPAIVPAEPGQVVTTDHVRDMERQAEQSGRATWGHWGILPDRYVEWSNHSNRLIPVYTFGLMLDAVSGPNSVYRDAARLESSLRPAARRHAQPRSRHTSIRPTSTGCSSTPPALARSGSSSWCSTASIGRPPAPLRSPRPAAWPTTPAAAPASRFKITPGCRPTSASASRARPTTAPRSTPMHRR